MDQPLPKKFSYDDYVAWTDERRWELIDGEPFSMSPGARPVHQRLVARIWSAISSNLRGSKCEAFISPIDIKLSEQNIVQPDIVVVCDPSQVTDTFIAGPPTLVVEVLSPSTWRHDRVRKLNLFCRFGISEYWIVTPEPAMLEVFSLTSDGAYRVAGTYTDVGEFSSIALPDVRIDLSDIFGPPQTYPDEVREDVPPSRAEVNPMPT